MKELKDLLVKQSDTIRTAIEKINGGFTQIALVVDSNDRLRGTVTDGDIRRGLLNGKNLDNPVHSIMCSEFLSVLDDTPQPTMLKFVNDHKINQLPVLDRAGKLIDIFVLDQFSSSRGYLNHVVIMAGGEGKRLLPLTKHCPKPMLRVQGKPILEILLERCRDDGFGHFYFAVNYLKEQIIDHFGDGTRWEVDIRYLEETQPRNRRGIESHSGDSKRSDNSAKWRCFDACALPCFA